jgi:hypothetical protein
MIKWIKWYFSDTKKPVVEHHIDFYEKFLELEEKYNSLLKDVVRLEEENIETTNTLYELMNNISALDSRIDIIAEHCGIIGDV